MSTPPGTSTTDSLAMSLDPTCPAEHAFAVWTTRIDFWWPSDHTVSGCPNGSCCRATSAAGSSNVHPRASSTTGVG